MARLFVCSIDKVPEVAAQSGARDLVTLIRAHHPMERPASIAADRHLRLSFNDITEPRDGLTLVQGEQVSELLRFVVGWDRKAPLLIHCFAGVSRSTAAAFVTACALRPEIGEENWALQLRAASPTATPNARLIALADDLLAREGRMIRAIQDIGRGAECHSGIPFSLDLAA